MNQVLPKGWLDTKLGSIVDYGKAVKSVLSDVEPDSWILELEDIEKDSSKLLKLVTASERPFKSTKNTFKKGDVLYGKLRPYLNKVIVAIEDGVCSTEIIPINSEPFCLNKYMFYWLKCSKFLHYVDEVSHGVNMPRLGTSDGKSAPFRLAPLAEQKEIVTQLDKLLAQVESTKARLDAIPTILKRFRQSVLAAAVSGELTEKWRSDESKLWKKIKLQEAANIIDPQPSHRTPKAVEGGVPYVSIGDLKSDGTINFEGARKVSHDVLVEHKARYQLKKGDFVFGKIGTLGKATELPIDIEYTLSANVILIQPNTAVSLPKFIQYFLSSPTTMEEVARQSNSTSQAAFGIKKMRAFVCELPSLVEQTEIVRHVEELFGYADNVEAQVNAAQERVNNLTQSILAKAFSGELTAKWRAQNPDLITGENSAEALLEKIKEERAALAVKNKTTRKKKTIKKVVTKKIVKLAKELSNPIERVLATEGALSPQQIFDKLANDLSLPDVFAEIAKLLADNKIAETSKDGVKAVTLTL
ncbi:MAG: restriction endonuclease subunit S [Gammaproteobacteria bacterium]|nr:MAG: restriction endonuclease subunit S [Gammaproteobacteria bacterium]PHR84068.1 MAG: restriction endonuclease subunit S [Colwellia sp.]